jgi:hypothetical protein
MQNFPISRVLLRAYIFVRDYHQQLANYTTIIVALTAIISVWTTFLSLKNSAKNLEQQLTEQKHATSVLILSDFMTNVGDELLTLQEKRATHESCIAECQEASKGQDCSTKCAGLEIYKEGFERLLITRSQLLLDGLEFPDLAAQLLRFLGRNRLEHLFSVERGFSKNPFIQVISVDLSMSNIGQIAMDSPLLSCSNLNTASLSASKLHLPTIRFTDMAEASLIQTQIFGGNVHWVNLHGAKISSFTTVENTAITFSNLTGLIGNDIAGTQAGRITAQNIAAVLSKARSLYGSIVDEGVDAALRSSLDPKEYDNLFNNPHRVLQSTTLANSDAEESIESRVMAQYEKWFLEAHSDWESKWIEMRRRNCHL